jgi:uncharacterized protein (DUF608 family)
MGRKGYQGESPSDISINAMDKFITKNTKKQSTKEKLSGRRKDPNIPIDLWPVEDQIEYWNNRPLSEQFKEQYPTYQQWIDAVREKTGVYHVTFRDYTYKHRELLQQMYQQCVSVIEASRQLYHLGVY